MKEGDVLFACGVGKVFDGTYVWRATGMLLKEFCLRYAPEWSPVEESNITVGPFKSEETAKRDLARFERAYLKFARERFPGLKFRNAPDPRTLN